MPITSSAKKALKVDIRRAIENKTVRARFKALIKKGDVKKAQAAIDKAAKLNVIHKNRAARLKSRLMRAKKA